MKKRTKKGPTEKPSGLLTQPDITVRSIGSLTCCFTGVIIKVAYVRTIIAFALIVTDTLYTYAVAAVCIFVAVYSVAFGAIGFFGGYGTNGVVNFIDTFTETVVGVFVTDLVGTINLFGFFGADSVVNFVDTFAETVVSVFITDLVGTINLFGFFGADGIRLRSIEDTILGAFDVGADTADFGAGCFVVGVATFELTDTGFVVAAAIVTTEFGGVFDVVTTSRAGTTEPNSDRSGLG